MLADRLSLETASSDVFAVATKAMSGCVAEDDRLGTGVGVGVTSDGAVPVEGTSLLHAGSTAIVRAATDIVLRTSRSITVEMFPNIVPIGADSAANSPRLLDKLEDCLKETRNHSDLLPKTGAGETLDSGPS